MISLEHHRLRVFRELAAQGSFRRTAEALYVSQPAVTQAIKQLEEELETSLFDRAGTGNTGASRVRLTPAGTTLLRYATQSELLLGEATAAIAALRGEVSGALHIAASTTIAQYVLPVALAEFARTHPAVTLSLASDNTERVVAAVADGVAPIGMIEGPARRAEVRIEPWLRDELLLVVPASHVWAGRQVPVAALQAAALLLREPGSGTRVVVEAALRNAGFDIASAHVVLEVSSTEAMLACIEAGLGVGFCSRFAVERQRALGTLAVARVEGLRIRRTLSLVQPRRGGAGGAAAKDFVASLRAMAAAHARRSARTARHGRDK